MRWGEPTEFKIPWTKWNKWTWKMKNNKTNTHQPAKEPPKNTKKRKKRKRPKRVWHLGNVKVWITRIKTTNKKKQCSVCRFSRTHTNKTHARIPNRTFNAQVFKIAVCFHLQPRKKPEHKFTCTHFTICRNVDELSSTSSRCFFCVCSNTFVFVGPSPKRSPNFPTFSTTLPPSCKVCACFYVIFCDILCESIATLQLRWTRFLLSTSVAQCFEFVFIFCW